LKARCDEAREICAASRNLPEHLRNEVKYPLPTLARARELFREFSIQQNFRRDHNIEDFQEVMEWWDGSKWQLCCDRTPPPAGAQLQARKEMPVERALRLIRAVEKWDRTSPDVVITFLEHSQRWEKIEANGEIKMTWRKRDLVFSNPGSRLEEGARVLCYHNEQEPEFLHVTTGDGRYLGCWSLRGRGAFLDREALAQAMRYTHAAREAARTIAGELAAPQRAALDDMRTHNSELLRPFEVVTDAPTATARLGTNVIAQSLEAVKASAAGIRKAKQAEEKFVRTAGVKAANDFLGAATAVETSEAETPEASNFLDEF
jgi:hypothetical protein